MLTTKLTKKEILKKIEEEYKALSRFAGNTKDPGFKEYEQTKVKYLEQLIEILGITREEE